jgi:hypothetical protein
MTEASQTQPLARSRRVRLTDADIQVLRALVRGVAEVCRSDDVQLELAHIDKQLSQAAAVRPRSGRRHG